MAAIDLKTAAARLPQAWRSAVLAERGEARLKLLRMDGAGYPEEAHAAPEGLLVLDGHMNLTVEGAPVRVVAGELYVVPTGVAHAVAEGSTGTLLIFELDGGGKSAVGT